MGVDVAGIKTQIVPGRFLQQARSLLGREDSGRFRTQAEPEVAP